MTTILRMRTKTVVKGVPEIFSKYTPRGCPYRNYTLTDLLGDWVSMYDWRLEIGKEYSLPDFISLLSKYYGQVQVYGPDMIEIEKGE